MAIATSVSIAVTVLAIITPGIPLLIVLVAVVTAIAAAALLTVSPLRAVSIVALAASARRPHELFANG